jgi:hypothetical protein
MKLTMLVGIVLFVIGIGTAVVGIVGVGRSTDSRMEALDANQGTPAFAQTVRHFAVPAVAGLSLAIGGLLIGLSMGNWRHPRTHLEPGDEIVDPEGYHKMKHV